MTKAFDQELVNKVIRGEYGNGGERIRRLKEKGYDIDDIQAIQSEVNKYFENIPKDKRSIFTRIKDYFFWRDKYCKKCGCYRSISNWSPCTVCHRGDMALLDYGDEDAWWREYGRRIHARKSYLGWDD